MGNQDKQFHQSILPLQFLADFMALIGANPDKINVFTYNDLEWNGDWDYKNHYPNELRAWKKSLKNKAQDPNKIHVLFQHDVDNCPDRTMDLLEVQEEYGIRSNVMIFNNKIDRKHLKKTGEATPSNYPIDHNRFAELERGGFVIGYHSNAYEQAEFDRDKASEIFVQDVEELRSKHSIQVFCPHGGNRDENGESNATLDLPVTLRRSLKWVLNKYTIRLDGRYSDGGIRGARQNPESRDLREHVLSWKPGKRYRILVHPQYYGTTYCRSTKLIPRASWYSDLLDCYDNDRGLEDWWGPVAKKLKLSLPTANVS